MNPRGVSVFYGAKERETALAEIRPPVGSFVLMGQFQPIRLLKVLDMTQYLPNPTDIWDDQLPQKLAREDFIIMLSNRIARPILPADTELDYIPTQVFAEYCARKGFDGVLFMSAQKPDGKNVILFRHAARVAMPNGHAKTEEDHREPSLELIEGSVQKIEITGVHFTTSPPLTPEAQA